MTITDPVMLLVLSFVALFALLLIGIPIAISLTLVGVIGLFAFMGDTSLASLMPFRTLNSFILTAVPLFVFMGEILVNCGASDMIYRGASRLLAWLPGGLLHSNIASCAMFAAVSGSSPATAATIGTVAYPALQKRRYDKTLTLGSLAAGGTLGILIPPSINMIVYGAVADQSVGRLFAAGVIPGLILSGFFMIYIAVRVALNPGLAPREAKFDIRTALLSVTDLWPLFILLLVVLGGVFGGFMTPTESAAVGSFVSLVLAIVLRRFTREVLFTSLRNTVAVSCMVLFIMVGASILAAFFARAGIPQAVTSSFGHYSRWIIFVYVVIIYLILGCFIDPVSIILLTASTVVPLIKALGFDLIWFGIIYVITAEVGMLTPPMGMNLFVIQGISRETIGKVVEGSWPFFVIQTASIALFCFFPDLILWMPNALFGPQ